MFSLKSLFGHPPETGPARALYAATIHAARRPEMFTDMALPDTPEGRFEALALMAFLVLKRLKSEPTAKRISQAYFDVMFDDVDSNLRELGVGDMSVGKKVKKLAESFYGRIRTYDAALAAPDDGLLIEALRRYPYRGAEPTAAHVERLARQVRRDDAALAAQPADKLLAGDIAFAAIAAAEEGTQ